MRLSAFSSLALCTAALLTGAFIAGCEVHGTTQVGGDTKVSTLVAAPQTADTPTTKPANGDKYTYVVCHGAWAGGFEWKKVSELLLKDGHTMYRPTYTGNGERSHLSNPDIDLNTHITDITNVILFENLHDVVLIGHSYGGMVMTGVADRVPDRVKCLIYVDAFLPENGESLNTTRPPTPPATGPAATNPARGRGQQIVNGMMGAAPRPGARPPYNVPQSAKTFSQPIELKNQDQTRKIPVTYILTVDPGRTPERDAFFFSYTRAKTRGNTAWMMESDHVPSMTHPVELVKLLEEAPVNAKAQEPK